ncbi:MAG: hypothetical protein LBI91_08560 [Spirochaetaceae bacterium]|nr:hypothetical protein [Spirochaetaceae bacterium]
MVKKINLIGCALLFVFFFTGCAGGGKPQEDAGETPGEDGDIWYAVTSAEELIGEWEGSIVLNVPADESKGFPETVFYVSMSLSCTEQGAEQGIKIGFGDFLADLLAAHPDTALTADDLWEEYFENIYAGYILIKDEYALVVESSGPAEDLLGNSNDKLYINQDGTRLREFLGGGLLEPFGVPGNIEFVMEKL